MGITVTKEVNYRVSHRLSDLGWVDFGYSTVCPILLEQMRVWQNGSWARWVKHPNQSQPNPGPRGDGSPCNQEEAVFFFTQDSCNTYSTRLANLGLRTGLDCGTKARICNGALRATTDPELIWSPRGLFANSKEDDSQEMNIAV